MTEVNEIHRIVGPSPLKNIASDDEADIHRMCAFANFIQSITESLREINERKESTDWEKQLNQADRQVILLLLVGVLREAGELVRNRRPLLEEGFRLSEHSPERKEQIRKAFEYLKDAFGNGAKDPNACFYHTVVKIRNEAAFHLKLDTSPSPQLDGESDEVVYAVAGEEGVNGRFGRFPFADAALSQTAFGPEYKKKLVTILEVANALTVVLFASLPGLLLKHGCSER